MSAVREHSVVGADLPPEFLKEAENFYRRRASAALRSLKRALEAQMGQEFDPELSGKLDGVQAALEALDGNRTV